MKITLKVWIECWSCGSRVGERDVTEEKFDVGWRLVAAHALKYRACSCDETLKEVRAEVVGEQ